MGKIRLKCQIADLKTEVTCYVIENETSNSLLLGWEGRGSMQTALYLQLCTSVSSTLTRTVKYKESLRRGSLRGLKPIAKMYASYPEDEEKRSRSSP